MSEEKFADLHMHTHYSDGTSTPKQLLEEARKRNISCIAVTDHDTVDGIKPAQDLASEFGVEVLSGVEISSSYDGKDIHMLGYLFDPEYAPLAENLKRVQFARIDRMKNMVQKLHDLGIENISYEEVEAVAQSGSVGRPHLARVMNEKGIVATVQEAFDKYLANGAPAFVAEFSATPFDAIKLIKEAGGIAVLAHPMITKVDELIEEMVEAGLGGIECYYSAASGADTQKYLAIAEKYQLCVTGGSDAHGMTKPNIYIGKAKIPYHFVETLKAALQPIG